MAETMKLYDILDQYNPGDGGTWFIEFEWIWHNHRGHVEELVEDIYTHGIESPVLLGHDGRVWDGHHRLLAAGRLGIKAIPVEHAPTEEDVEDEASPLTPKESERIFRLALNGRSEDGDGSLSELIEVLHEHDMAYDRTRIRG